MSQVLWITGPTIIAGDGSITFDGRRSASNITNKRILTIAEVPPTATESRAGSSINVDIAGVKFQNAQVDSAGACVRRTTMSAPSAPLLASGLLRSRATKPSWAAAPPTPVAARSF